MPPDRWSGSPPLDVTRIMGDTKSPTGRSTGCTFSCGDHQRTRRLRARRAAGPPTSELLDAAVGAVREIGPGATMEQLAAAGGVTKPILYRHFGDRDGLIAAIAERFSTALLTSVTDAARGRRDRRSSCSAPRSTRYVGVHRAGAVPLPVPGPARRRTAAAATVRSTRSSTTSPSRWRSSPASGSARPAGTAGAAVPWAYGIVGPRPPGRRLVGRPPDHHAGGARELPRVAALGAGSATTPIGADDEA